MKELGLLQEEIIAAVLSAGAYMSEAHLCREDITDKEGDGNFVTRYDVAVQERLISALSRILPEAEYFAEEKEDNRLTDAPTFIIDPIDGTTNFILDFRHSAISVALCVERRAVLGVIYDPYQGELFYALHGCGAYLRRGGREYPLSVNTAEPDRALILFGTDPYRKSRTGELTSALFAEALRLFMDLRRVGSAALDLAYLAAGRAHGFFEAMLSPWDYAAGGLILTEAGGLLTNERGEEPPYVKSPIFAGSPAVHRALMRELLPAVRRRLGTDLAFYDLI